VPSKKHNTEYLPPKSIYFKNKTCKMLKRTFANLTIRSWLESLTLPRRAKVPRIFKNAKNRRPYKRIINKQPAQKPQTDNSKTHKTTPNHNRHKTLSRILYHLKNQLNIIHRNQPQKIKSVSLLLT